MRGASGEPIEQIDLLDQALDALGQRGKGVSGRLLIRVAGRRCLGCQLGQGVGRRRLLRLLDLRDGADVMKYGIATSTSEQTFSRLIRSAVGVGQGDAWRINPPGRDSKHHRDRSDCACGAMVVPTITVDQETGARTDWAPPNPFRGQQEVGSRHAPPCTTQMSAAGRPSTATAAMRMIAWPDEFPSIRRGVVSVRNKLPCPKSCVHSRLNWPLQSHPQRRKEPA